LSTQNIALVIDFLAVTEPLEAPAHHLVVHRRHQLTPTQQTGYLVEVQKLALIIEYLTAVTDD